MKITTINFQRLISTGSFENIRIGAEASLEPGESPDEAFPKLVEQVDNFLKAMNIEDMRGTQERVIEKVEPKTQMQMLIEAIKGSSDLKVLNSFKILVKGKPEAEAAYLETEKQLTNG